MNPTYFPYSEDLTVEDPATYERNLLIHRINTELVPQFEEAGKNRTVFHSYDIDVSDSEIGTLAKGDFSLKYLAADNQTVLGPADETFIKDRFPTVSRSSLGLQSILKMPGLEPGTSRVRLPSALNPR